MYTCASVVRDIEMEVELSLRTIALVIIIIIIIYLRVIPVLQMDLLD